MDLPVAGAGGMVLAFALWGSPRPLPATAQLPVAFRCRSLVPAMVLMVVLHMLLRMLVGRLKPVTFAHTPPGATGNHVILPLAVLMLALSLRSGVRDVRDAV